MQKENYLSVAVDSSFRALKIFAATSILAWFSFIKFRITWRYKRTLLNLIFHVSQIVYPIQYSIKSMMNTNLPWGKIASWEIDSSVVELFWELFVLLHQPESFSHLNNFNQVLHCNWTLVKCFNYFINWPLNLKFLTDIDHTLKNVELFTIDKGITMASQEIE